jgi:(2Fe-2S) ferredoxin
VPKRYQILVCRGPECGDKRRSSELHATFQELLKTTPLGGNEAILDHYSCFGRCQRGPNVLVREMKPTENLRMILLMPTAGPGAYLYNMVKPGEVRQIVEEHLANGRPLIEMTRRK